MPQGDVEFITISSGRIHDVVRAALLVITWNAVVSKKAGVKTQLRWRTSDDFPPIAGVK